MTAPDSSHPAEAGSENPVEQSEKFVPPIPFQVGRKFAATKEPLLFPGNTIVWHVDPQCEFYRWLQGLKAELEGIATTKLSWLPEASWHVTLFEGVCDTVRGGGFWPPDLAGASLQQVNEAYSRRLADFSLARQPPPYRFEFHGDLKMLNALTLRVVPATPADEEAVRLIRHRLADLLSIRHPGHGDYRFHLSFAYMVEYLDEDELAAMRAITRKHLETVPPFEFGLPEFCLFKDMFEFVPQHALGESPSK